MKTKFLLSIMMLFVTSLMYAQTQSLPLAGRFTKRAIGTIQDGAEVKGYTVFARVDKADKKNDIYAMNVYDENLNKVKTLEFKKPKKVTFLLDNAFNGDAMALLFYNTKEKTYEVESYDKGLNKLSSKKFSKASKFETTAVAQNVMMEMKTGEAPALGVGLYAVPGKGFVKNGFTDKGKGYAFTMFDNNMNEKWTFETPVSAKENEMFFIYDISPKYIAGTIIRRPSKTSKKLTYYVAVIDVEKGAMLIDAPIETSNSEQLSINGISIDPDKEEFIVSGDFYKIDAKPGVDRSIGFYVKKFTPDGKVISQAQYAWDKEVKSVLPEEAKASVEKGFLNFTHSVVVDGSGNIYIITEQYRKVADALGIAANVLSQSYDASMSKIQIENMMLFSLKPSLELSSVHFYDKNKGVRGLPRGLEFYGMGIIGLYLKQNGGFDYQFVQRSNDRNSYNVAFSNWDKEKGEKAQKYIGNIMFDEQGKFNLDKIDVTNKASAFFVYPSKPGHVMMVDWLKKEKTVGMKLVKLNN